MKLRFDDNNDYTINNHEFTDDLTLTIRDGKGRTVGARVLKGTMTAVELPDDARGWNNHKNVDGPGVYFRVHVQATRDDKLFGAGQTNQYFKTYEDAQAYVTKRLASMEKRARKSFGK